MSRRLNDEMADAIDALYADREKPPPTPAEMFAAALESLNSPSDSDPKDA